jgi:hypothetical protein
VDGLFGRLMLRYLLIPSFFMWSFAMPSLDIVPFDIPFPDIPVVERLPLVSVAPAGGCAGFLLASCTLGWLLPVCGVVVGVCAKAPAIANAVMAAAVLPIKMPVLMFASSVSVACVRSNAGCRCNVPIIGMDRPGLSFAEFKTPALGRRK